MDVIFSNILGIYQFHSEVFFPKLQYVQQQYQKDIDTLNLTSLEQKDQIISMTKLNEIISIEDFFKIMIWPFQFLYKPYYANFKKSTEFLSTFKKNKKQKYFNNILSHMTDNFGFAESYSIFERSSKKRFKKFNNFLKSACARMDHSQVDLNGYLILPIQRLPRYLLLLEKLAKYLGDGNEERIKLSLFNKDQSETPLFDVNINKATPPTDDDTNKLNLGNNENSNEKLNSKTNSNTTINQTPSDSPTIKSNLSNINNNHNTINIVQSPNENNTKLPTTITDNSPSNSNNAASVVQKTTASTPTATVTAISETESLTITKIKNNDIKNKAEEKIDITSQSSINDSDPNNKLINQPKKTQNQGNKTLNQNKNKSITSNSTIKNNNNENKTKISSNKTLVKNNPKSTIPKITPSTQGKTMNTTRNKNGYKAKLANTTSKVNSYRTVNSSKANNNNNNKNINNSNNKSTNSTRMNNSKPGASSRVNNNNTKTTTTSSSRQNNNTKSTINISRNKSNTSSRINHTINNNAKSMTSTRPKTNATNLTKEQLHSPSKVKSTMNSNNNTNNTQRINKRVNKVASTMTSSKANSMTSSASPNLTKNNNNKSKLTNQGRVNYRNNNASKIATPKTKLKPKQENESNAIKTNANKLTKNKKSISSTTVEDTTKTQKTTSSEMAISSSTQSKPNPSESLNALSSTTKTQPLDDQSASSTTTITPLDQSNNKNDQGQEQIKSNELPKYDKLNKQLNLKKEENEKKSSNLPNEIKTKTLPIISMEEAKDNSSKTIMMKVKEAHITTLNNNYLKNKYCKDYLKKKSRNKDYTIVMAAEDMRNIIELCNQAIAKMQS